MRVFSFEIRNGFGFDLEATNSKILTAVKIDSAGEHYTEFVRFNGLVLLLPFCLFIYGTIYEIDNG